MVYFVGSYGFVTFEHLEDAEKLMKREVMLLLLLLVVVVVVVVALVVVVLVVVIVVVCHLEIFFDVVL